MARERNLFCGNNPWMSKSAIKLEHPVYILQCILCMRDELVQAVNSDASADAYAHKERECVFNT